MKGTQGTGRADRKKTGMPLSRAELGSAWAGFQVMQFLPSPYGNLLPEGLWLCFQGDP